MKNVFVNVLFLGLIAIGGALKCYKCDMDNPNCSDPFNENAPGVNVITCADTYVCYKASGSITLSGVTLKGTQRNCILDTLVQPCMLIKMGLESQDVKDIQCYTCSTDNCNAKTTTGAASRLTSPKIFLLPLLISFFWRTV